jgi:hypothetical protein
MPLVSDIFIYIYIYIYTYQGRHFTNRYLFGQARTKETFYIDIRCEVYVSLRIIDSKDLKNSLTGPFGDTLQQEERGSNDPYETNRPTYTHTHA